MWRVARRGLAAAKGRYALSLLAVVLGVSFLAGTLQLGSLLGKTFEELVGLEYPADVYVRGANQGAAHDNPAGVVALSRNPVPLDLAAELEQRDDVRAAGAEISGAALIAGQDGTPVASGQTAPPIGMSYRSAELNPHTRLVEGRAPTGPKEVAIAEDTARRGDLSVGSQTTALLGGEPVTVEVVGIVGTSTNALAGATLTFFEPSEATAAFAPDGTVPTVAIYSEGTAPEILAQRITQSLDPDLALEVITGQQLRQEYTAEIRGQVGFITTLVGVFAAVALFVGAFLIINTFTVAVGQQTAEYALLRAMGASRRQVLASVLAQGVAIGLLGSALGLVGGWGLIKLATWGMAQFDMTLAAASGISLVDAALALAAGTLTAVLGAALPARRAASVTPVEAMREPGEAPGKPLALRSLVGGMVLAGGAAACLTGALAAEPNGAVAGVGAAALVVGALIAAPGVGKLTAKAAEPVTSRLAGISGRLASRNIQRQPRRAALAGSALMIGLTLVAAAAVLAGSMRSAVTSVITQVFTTDLLVQSVNGEIPPPALAELRQLPEVRHADAYAEAPITYEGQDLWVGSSQTDAFGRTFTFETSPGAWAALAEGQAVVREAAAREQGWNTGDVLELEGPGGRIAVTVGGTYQRGLGAEELILPWQVLDQLTDGAAEDAVAVVMITGTDSVTAAALRQAVADVAAPYMVLSIQDMAEFTKSQIGMIDTVLVVVYALLGLSVILAALGIVNTLALSVIQRRRELGLLRAVGLGSGQTARMVVLESVILSVGGAVAGLVLGTALGALLTRLLRDQGLDQLAIPWGQLAAMAVIAALVGVVASVQGAIRAVRTPILTAVAAT